MDKEEIDKKLRAFTEENGLTISQVFCSAKRIISEWSDDVSKYDIEFIRANTHIPCSQLGKKLGYTQRQVYYIMKLYGIERPKGYRQSQFGILDIKTGRKYLSIEQASIGVGRSYQYVCSKRDRFIKIDKADVTV
jgi:hypothetical protein